MTEEELDKTFDDPVDALLFNFIKKFNSRLSSGFVHIEVTCIILDSLVTKKNKMRNDLYLVKALAVVTKLLKDHGIMEAQSFS
jgi:hypothetical protein